MQVPLDEGPRLTANSLSRAFVGPGSEELPLLTVRVCIQPLPIGTAVVPGYFGKLTLTGTIQRQ